MMNEVCCGITFHADIMNDIDELIRQITHNDAMQDPFQFSELLSTHLCAGVFSGHVLQTIIGLNQLNPLTRQPIAPIYLPLTHNLAVIKAHMCQFFAHGKNMHHLIFVYLGFLSQMCDIEMFSSYRDAICGIITVIANGPYRTFASLSQEVTSEAKVSIADAFTRTSSSDNVCAYFLAHSEPNNRVFMNIAFILTAGSKHLYALQQQEMHKRALKVVECFRTLYYTWKGNKLHLIEYRFKTDVSCQIAFELYTLHDTYKDLSVSKALQWFLSSSSKYAQSVRMFIESDRMTNCITSLPPSASLHDGNIQELMALKGYTQLPYNKCIYCDLEITLVKDDAKQMAEHIKEMTGDYFISANRSVRRAIRALTRQQQPLNPHSVLIKVYDVMYTELGTEHATVNGKTLYDDIVSIIAVQLAART
jgi:hypothetical protein